MKIAFFTEAGYIGPVDRNNPNMRTDQAWVCALGAFHYPVTQLPQNNFDVGIVIIPKEKNREHLAYNDYPLVSNIKALCSRVYVMQESTQWDWQDDSFNSMVWYYNQLIQADGILCHNDIDVPYFEGITGKPAQVLPTLMIEDAIKVSDEKLDITKNVYITENKNEATMIIYKASTMDEAIVNKGFWYITDWKAEASLSVFITPFKSEADEIIFYTINKKEAGIFH